MEKKDFQNLRKEVMSASINYRRTVRLVTAEFLLWTILAGTVTYFKENSMILLSTSVVVAVLMFRHFAIMHDCVHNAFFGRKKIWNNLLGNVSAIVCFLPFEPWRKVHLEHHYWSGNIDKDPVMALVHAYPKWPKFLKRICTMFWRLWVPVLAVLQYGVFWIVCLQNTFTGKGTWHMRMSSLAPPLLWGTLFWIIPNSVVLFTLLPGVTIYLILVEVVNLPHHLELPKLEGEQVLKAREQYLTARSCVYPRWVAEYVTLNFNYHIEHHLFPQEPWHKLDLIAAKLKAALGQAYNTDPLFEWIIKSKKLDLETVIKTQGEAQEYEKSRSVA